MKGLDKVGTFAKGELSGTKAEIVVNSLDDIAKHGLKSIDEIVNKAKITSLLELKRIGISSVDDLMTLGVTTAKDLPKLGIHTMKDLAELGIKSADDLVKLGIKNVDDFIEAGLGTLDDAHRVSKEASRAKVNADDIKFTDKFSKPSYGNQVANRGWNNQKLADAIHNPYKVVDSVNNFIGNQAKVYFINETHYVVIDSVTNKVVQVSDLTKEYWKFTPGDFTK